MEESLRKRSDAGTLWNFSFIIAVDSCGMLHTVV